MATLPEYITKQLPVTFVGETAMTWIAYDTIMTLHAKSGGQACRDAFQELNHQRFYRAKDAYYEYCVATSSNPVQAKQSKIQGMTCCCHTSLVFF
jgi:hypothetical protein